MKDYWKPIVAGLFVYSCLTYGLIYGFRLLDKPEFMSRLGYFEMLKWVIPGLVVGYLSKGSGIVLGAIVGFLFVLIAYLMVPIAFSSGVTIPLFFAFFTKTLILSTFMNAVGGGCGELIRLKRTVVHKEEINEAT